MRASWVFLTNAAKIPASFLLGAFNYRDIPFYEMMKESIDVSTYFEAKTWTF